MSSPQSEIHLRTPRSGDGYPIHQLIAHSPPLDLNSIYSYHLLCDHFRDTCVVAESQERVVGFLSAYRNPHCPETLFVWQVVVDRALRGQRIAWRMLEALLQRPGHDALQRVEATVNPGNVASRALFERLAAAQGSRLTEAPYLDAEDFGPGGEHEREILLQVPLQSPNSSQ